MNFERHIDPKKALNIGLEKAVLDIIQNRLASAENFTQGQIIKKQIIKEIQDLTGWEEVTAIYNYDYPYLWKFRVADDKNNEIKIITINPRLEDGF